jgi:hypothetical protein
LSAECIISEQDRFVGDGTEQALAFAARGILGYGARTGGNIGGRRGLARGGVRCRTAGKVVFAAKARHHLSLLGERRHGGRDGQRNRHHQG